MPIFSSEGLSFDARTAEEAALQIVKEAIEKNESLGTVFSVTNEQNEEFFFTTEALIKELDEIPGPRLAKNDDKASNKEDKG